jgi:hypothetical protein
MRSLAALCILCLVIIGTGTAATISPGIAREIGVISTIDPHKISINHPQATLMGMLSVTSTPSGATVMIDGSSTLYGASIPNTPFSSLNIVSGQHTITLKRTGYADYSATFSVSPGATASVNAQLQPLKVMVDQLKPVVASGAVARNIAVQGASGNTPVPTPTLLLCPSGYSCESLAKAQSDYGTDGYTQYGTLPCNYTGSALNKEQVREYCIKRKTLPIAVRKIPVSNLTIAKPAGGIIPAVQQPAIITHVAFVDKFLGSAAPVSTGNINPDILSSFFAGIFGKPVSVQPAVPADVCVCQPPFYCSEGDGTNAQGDPCNCHTCNGQCVDLSADKTNCGSCGNVCPADDNCYNGQCFWDVGRCGTAADCEITRWPLSPDLNEEWQCVNTYCNETCKAGYLSCKLGTFDVCRDILNDNYNCGSCDRACLYTGYSCQNGECKMVN